jgi:hypothetical protein
MFNHIIVSATQITHFSLSLSLSHTLASSTTKENEWIKDKRENNFTCKVKKPSATISAKNLQLCRNCNTSISLSYITLNFLFLHFGLFSLSINS